MLTDTHEPIALYPTGRPVPFETVAEEPMPTIVPYYVDHPKGTIVIFPGGGYFIRSDDSEGHDIARGYNEAGYAAFVVKYRIKPHGGKAILQDACRAMRYVRFHCTEWHGDADKIAVCGFSAGGHLALMTCQHAMEDAIGDELSSVSSYPNGCVLCYAVTTFMDGTFDTMPEVFLGEEKRHDEALLKKYSGEYNDAAHQPPTFLWASTRDEGVDPYKNSVRLAAWLAAKKVTHELHLYGDGGHGIGRGYATPGCFQWLTQSTVFLKEQGM